MNAATVSPHSDASARAHHADYRAGILSGVVGGDRHGAHHDGNDHRTAIHALARDAHATSVELREPLDERESDA